MWYLHYYSRWRVLYVADMCQMIQVFRSFHQKRQIQSMRRLFATLRGVASIASFLIVTQMGKTQFGNHSKSGSRSTIKRPKKVFGFKGILKKLATSSCKWRHHQCCGGAPFRVIFQAYMSYLAFGFQRCCQLVILTSRIDQYSFKT